MLKKLYVNNFKTLMDFTFEPKGVNLLIGRNNVGKSSVCQALEFLACSTFMPLYEAPRVTIGSASSIGNRFVGDSVIQFVLECGFPVGGCDSTFRYELVLEPREDADPWPVVVSEWLSVTREDLGPVPVLDRTRDRAKVFDGSVPPQPGTPLLSDMVRETEIAPYSTFLNALKDAPEYSLAALFKRYLRSWWFNEVEVSRLRSTRVGGPEPVLARGGDNLSSVLRRLKSKDQAALDEVIHLARSVEPDIDSLEFPKSPDPDQVFMRLKTRQGAEFAVSELSGGTLRVLALAYVAVVNRAASENGLVAPRLTVFEEPETGVFVGQLRKLFDALDPSGRAGQYIFTSHSPYFIDLFDGNLDGVFLLKREGERTVMSQPDPAKTKELLEEFSLGELHFREMLG